MKRRLFSVKFDKMLQKGALLANIDETTIGRHSQIPYSWSNKESLQSLKTNHL